MKKVLIGIAFVLGCLLASQVNAQVHDNETYFGVDDLWNNCKATSWNAIPLDASEAPLFPRRECVVGVKFKRPAGIPLAHNKIGFALWEVRVPFPARSVFDVTFDLQPHDIFASPMGMTPTYHAEADYWMDIYTYKDPPRAVYYLMKTVLVKQGE